MLAIPFAVYLIGLALVLRRVFRHAGEDGRVERQAGAQARARLDWDLGAAVLDLRLDPRTRLVRNVTRRVRAEIVAQEIEASAKAHQADVIGRSLEITEWISHPQTLRIVLSALKNFLL